jgi:adenosylcobinamide kinase/adenosylcobinamide-phosphate guanylyltransferase
LKELIIGGARSGKTRLAQQRATASALEVCYIATATAGDEEMSARIQRHRLERPSEWQLIEEPVALAEALRQSAAPGRCLIVDCLTLWLSNLLCFASDAELQQQRQALLDLLPGLPGHIILVSNEINMGVVPMGELSRRFCDEAGWLHQSLAQQCQRVTLTVAGLPLLLKGDPH